MVLPEPTPPADAIEHTPADRGRALWSLPWLVACCAFFSVEVYRNLAGGRTTTGPIDFFLGADLDALIWLGLLLAAPLLWWGDARGLARGRLFGRIARTISSATHPLRDRKTIVAFRAAALSLVVGAASLLASARVGARFDDLPPAYHDEYSYLFQAETFLAGRLSFPSHEAARLFDQMHVLNEGRFASRYFPGAGLWLAPFVAAGHPYWGQWLAGALCAMCMFWSGRELAGDAAGFIAGMLTALSPGMSLFSNLLLAHHPTLFGLGLFLVGYLRMLRRGSVAWAQAAGAGLAFAMLCRPLTAAGVAFPFGVHFLIWICRGRISKSVECHAGQGQTPEAAPALRQRIGLAASMAIPIGLALAGQFLYDRAITGSGWLTPYTLYTDIYTPRHVYGFNNVVRGEQHLGPRVLDNYDAWAENLTVGLAIANARTRLVASWIWTLGLVPLSLSLSAGLVFWRRIPPRAWLVLAGIVSLHAAYFPYWYVGIDYYHYVFETLPLWGLWTGVVSAVVLHSLQTIGKPSLAWWWGAALSAAAALNFTVCGGLWSAPLAQGIGQLRFARTKHEQFQELVAQRARPLPALVLVEADPADRHIDYVTNSPDLAGPVLIGRYLPDEVPIAEVKRLFPDRALFLYRARSGSWSRIE